MTEERTFPNATESIVKARRYALEALRGVAPEINDAVAVMVSELATNSVRHAASEFTISIDRDARTIRVAVTDAGDDLPNLRSPAPNEHSGRGLQIVSALADHWGVSEMVDRPGKTVWFELTMPTPSRAAGVGESTTEPALAPRRADEPRREPGDGRHGGPSTPTPRARRGHQVGCHTRRRILVTPA